MNDESALLGVVLTFDLVALLWLTAANLIFTGICTLWFMEGRPWSERLLLAVGIMSLCTLGGFAVLSWASDVPLRDAQLIVLWGRSP